MEGHHRAGGRKNEIGLSRTKIGWASKIKAPFAGLPVWEGGSEKVTQRHLRNRRISDKQLNMYYFPTPGEGEEYEAPGVRI